VDLMDVLDGGYLANGFVGFVEFCCPREGVCQLGFLTVFPYFSGIAACWQS